MGRRFDASLNVFRFSPRLTYSGNDYIHQLKLITKLLGTPTAEELSFVTNHKARRFMLNLPKEAPGSLSQKYPDASPEALDLLSKMLVIDPARRISVAEALEQPYLSSLHDPGIYVYVCASLLVAWDDLLVHHISDRKSALLAITYSTLFCFCL